MKKYFIILIFLMTGFAAFSQEEADNNDKAAKIRDRMNEFIQNRLGLSRNEAERFTPIFLRYFRDFNHTHREFKGDRLILQQKIIELRLRYRNEFKNVMDEKRANKVYVYEDEFRRKAIQILENRKDRLGEKPLRRNRSILQ